MAHEQTFHQQQPGGDDDDSDDHKDEPAKKGTGIGRRKINIEFIEDKGRRHITFSKRKAGIMKKAYELSTLTGTQVLLLVASETGHVYTFSTPKLQPMITKPEGKNLIQACLNAPDNTPSSPPASRQAYPEPPPPSNNLVPFQPGNSSDSLSSSYDEYEKEDKERRNPRIPASYKPPQPSGLVPYANPPMDGHHHLNAPMDPANPYSAYAMQLKLMQQQQQQQQQQTHPQHSQPPQSTPQGMYQSLSHVLGRYGPSSAGGPPPQYGGHPSQESSPYMASNILSQPYPPQGYAGSYWPSGGSSNAPSSASEKQETSESSSHASNASH